MDEGQAIRNRNAFIYNKENLSSFGLQLEEGITMVVKVKFESLKDDNDNIASMQYINMQQGRDEPYYNSINFERRNNKLYVWSGIKSSSLIPTSVQQIESNDFDSLSGWMTLGFRFSGPNTNIPSKFFQKLSNSNSVTSLGDAEKISYDKISTLAEIWVGSARLFNLRDLFSAAEEPGVYASDIKLRDILIWIGTLTDNEIEQAMKFVDNDCI
jgi:hypothetical protein